MQRVKATGAPIRWIALVVPLKAGRPLDFSIVRVRQTLCHISQAGTPALRFESTHGTDDLIAGREARATTEDVTDA